MLIKRQTIGQVPKGLRGFQVMIGNCDENLLVCLCSLEKGGMVFMSGKAGPTFDAIPQARFVNKGHSLAYCGTKDDKSSVVVNGEVIDVYDWVGKFSISRDESSIAYPVMRESPSRQEYKMVIDGVPGRAFINIGEAVWHPKELLLAYMAEEGKSERVVIGDNLLPAFERVRGLQFSPQGELYYWGFKEGNWLLNNSKKEIAVSEGEDPPNFGGILFGPDDTLGYWACKNGKWFVRYGDLSYGPWSGFQRIVGSPMLFGDHNSIGYVVEQDCRVQVCKNDHAGPEFDAVGRPICNWGEIAYKARLKHQEFLVIDNNISSKRYEVIWPEEREFATYLEDIPIISPKSKKIAFLASLKDGQTIVEAGQEQLIYQRISGQPTFSGETDRLVYGGQNGMESYVVVDTETIGPFDEIVSAKSSSGFIMWNWIPEFLENGTKLKFFTVTGDKIDKCVVEL